LEGLGMEKVGIFFGHLKYITAIWYISCPFDYLVAIWYSFPPFGILCQEKSGNPAQLTELKQLNCTANIIPEYLTI
jgi:hypothetical protein